MLSIHPPQNLQNAILAAGRNGSPRPRAVTAKILFDEEGNILTYIVTSEVLHMARGGDIASIINHLLSTEPIAEPVQTKRPNVKG
jgi:hypothetical protein